MSKQKETKQKRSSEQLGPAVQTETHPWQPFLPANATVLVLGSFPPPKKRWSMDFFYPNLQNDFWRIVGMLFFDDKNHFLTDDGTKFDQASIEFFLTQRGIAIFDAAIEIVRRAGNASDSQLEVVRPADLAGILAQLPQCRGIAVTGQKAAEIVWTQRDPTQLYTTQRSPAVSTTAPTMPVSAPTMPGSVPIMPGSAPIMPVSVPIMPVSVPTMPGVGESVEIAIAGRQYRLYRLPSSSRAYPKPLHEKAAFYSRMFDELLKSSSDNTSRIEGNKGEPCQ